MEAKIFGRAEIEATGATITIMEVGSDTWNESADLAASIASDTDFQKAVVDFVTKIRSGNRDFDNSTMKKIIEERYQNKPYFDSGVEFAAYSAVINSIDSNKDQSK